MVKIHINEKLIYVPKNRTVFQACQDSGVAVPHFCYHKSLKIAGNCRICLVEVVGRPKPVASCALPVSEGLIVFTTSSLTQKRRERVIEFMLINHPLDCPICDQGGECDLQDQSYFFGVNTRRFFNQKITRTDKNISPVIKTVITRCITCTRCVRFVSEYTNTSSLCTLGRRNHVEIGTYVKKQLCSSISRNLIDICPVGALTRKNYQFQSRPWERNYLSFTTLDLTSPEIQAFDVHSLNSTNKNNRVLPKGSVILSDFTRFNFENSYENLFEQYNTNILPISLDIANWFQIQKEYAKKTWIFSNFLFDNCRPTYWPFFPEYFEKKSIFFVIGFNLEWWYPSTIITFRYHYLNGASFFFFLCRNFF